MNKNPQHHIYVSNWLFGMAGLVFVMVIIGAITRLTESGLSMVEWRPLIGTIPPLNDQEWQRVFELYQETPEYQKKNFWMEIQDFKYIFFWEWFHRFMGRLIGLAYALPFFFFLLKNMIPSGYKLKLFLMLLLGGAQGVMGWFMVQSGLVDMPSVSHFRLAAHLGLAFLIFCLLILLAMAIRGIQQNHNPKLYNHGLVALGIVIITVSWGAFVAGLDAGLIYNEYPLMGERLIPSDMWHLSPAWINFFENPASVQFFHRWVAVLAVIGLLNLWWQGLKTDGAFFGFHAIGLMALLQFGLGIATILTGVNIVIASLHQAGALIILMLLMIILYRTKPARN